MTSLNKCVFSVPMPLIRSGAVGACHDLSDGGLVGAAAEMAMASRVGVELTATSPNNAHPFLFGECQGRYLLSVRDSDAVLAAASAAGEHAMIAGEAGGEDFASRGLFRVPLSELRAANEGWMPRWMS